GTTETYIAIAEVIGLSTGGILHDLGGDILSRWS
ncbi:unnamed protein product, partial [Allacma fusca]